MDHQLSAHKRSSRYIIGHEHKCRIKRVKHNDSNGAFRVESIDISDNSIKTKQWEPAFQRWQRIRSKSFVQLSEINEALQRNDVIQQANNFIDNNPYLFTQKSICQKLRNVITLECFMLEKFPETPFGQMVHSFKFCTPESAYPTLAAMPDECFMAMIAVYIAKFDDKIGNINGRGTGRKMVEGLVTACNYYHDILGLGHLSPCRSQTWKNHVSALYKSLPPCSGAYSFDPVVGWPKLWEAIWEKDGGLWESDLHRVRNWSLMLVMFNLFLRPLIIIEHSEST